jgi:glycine/D-amino acid oxidase-like deaminating enzyme
MSSQLFDLAVVGGGVIGLAHAFTAAKAGKRVAVIERDARANGASLRNFGFISRRVASRVKWCRGRDRGLPQNQGW